MSEKSETTREQRSFRVAGPSKEERRGRQVVDGEFSFVCTASRPEIHTRLLRVSTRRARHLSALAARRFPAPFGAGSRRLVGWLAR
jgi:hypothetical protein